MRQSLLLVEDDEGIRETTRFVLEDAGYDVDEAATAEQALDAFARRPADCVLIDIMLPGMDGFECCRSLRRHSDVPIIMLTARTDSFDVVAGLEAGADDYVRKPFTPQELAARIRALLRRAGGDVVSSTGGIRLGESIEILPDAGVVRRDGKEVHLTRTEFLLLCEMATDPGRLFSRETLLERVWGYDYFGDGKLVDVHVYRLRGKLEHDPSSPRHVLTVRGLGYKVQR